MKNIANLDIERVEDFPNRDKVRPPDNARDHYYGEDYPYNKVHRFLFSRVGNHWDNVFSEYCHLEWLPSQYRNKERIYQIVETNTFMKDGKVWFFDNYSRFSNEKSIDDMDNSKGYFYSSECFYIHPETKVLCYKHRKSKNQYKKEREVESAKTFRVLGDYHQLIKIKGIWYEVKGKPAESDIIVKDGLHYRVVSYHWTTMTDTTPYHFIDGKVCVPETNGRFSGKKISPKDCMIPLGGDEYYWNKPDYKSVKITSYRQLSSKELKKHGIANDIKTFGERCNMCGGFGCQQTHRK